MHSYELAARMQLAVPKVTDLSTETTALKQMYGLEGKETADFGRACLLARRLLEQGVRFVQLYSGGGHLEETWDAHESIEKNHGRHAAEIDKPIAALLADLEQRGLLESTLVVWGGEFGRMPFSEGRNAPGRNHNPYGFSMLLAVRGRTPGVHHHNVLFPADYDAEFDAVFGTAFAKSQTAAYGSLPAEGTVFVSVANRDKRSLVFPVKRLADLGFRVLATEGTAEMLRRNGIPCDEVRKHFEEPQPGR